MNLRQGKFTNSSGVTIPALGVFMVSSSIVGTDGKIDVKAVTPDGSDSLYYVNQLINIVDGNVGSHFTSEDIFPVLYDDAMPAPVVGDSIGPESGSFKASVDGKKLYRVVYGDPESTGAVVCRKLKGGGSGIKIARTTGEHCQGDTLPVEIMEGTKGSETGSGNYEDAYNRYMSLSANAIVIIADTGNGYEITVADCNDSISNSSCDVQDPSSGRVGL